MVTSDTMSIVRRFTSIFAVVTVSAMLGAAVPAASAGNAVAGTTVTATRSFPKTTTAKRDFLAEHTSTDIESNADWGGIESLDVPRPSLRRKRIRRLRSKLRLKLRLRRLRNRHKRKRRLELRLPAVLPNVPTSAFLRLLRVPLVRHWPTMLCSSKAIRMWLEAILRPAGIALVSCSGCSPSLV